MPSSSAASQAREIIHSIRYIDGNSGGLMCITDESRGACEVSVSKCTCGQKVLANQSKHWANDRTVLCSGGKDSCYSMLLCRQHGHSIVALANLCPAVGAPDELDSFMFQTVGHQLVAALAACAELPLYRRRIGGASKHTVRVSSPSTAISGSSEDPCTL